MRISNLLLALLLWVVSQPIISEEVDWITLESSGIKIIKLYGLSEGDRLTVTLFPLAAYNENNLIQHFYRIIDSDGPRLGEVINKFQIEQTSIPGLTVVTTLRRFLDGTGRPSLIHYQAFYFEHQQSMWFARTELNDNINLLVEYYGEELNMIMHIMGVKSNKNLL